MFRFDRTVKTVSLIGALIAIAVPATAGATVAPRDVNTGHGVVAPGGPPPVQLQDVDTEI